MRTEGITRRASLSRRITRAPPCHAICRFTVLTCRFAENDRAISAHASQFAETLIRQVIRQSVT